MFICDKHERLIQLIEVYLGLFSPGPITWGSLVSLVDMDTVAVI